LSETIEQRKVMIAKKIIADWNDISKDKVVAKTMQTELATEIGIALKSYMD
jgi:hypothetical protein